MKIGITDIACYLPPDRRNNHAMAAQLQTDEKFLDEKIGTREVSRLVEGQQTSDLATEACRALFAKTGLSPKDVQCLILCTQNPDPGGIPHTSAIVHAKLALSNQCACFDISLGCSGYVYGLSIASAFMDANDFEYGILVTADPYSPIIDPQDRNTVLIFGDGATATLLRPNRKAIYSIGQFIFSTEGGLGSAINNSCGRLEMNGRAVFEFCLREVPVQIRSLLAKGGVTLAEIDQFILHQGSRFIVEQIARALGAPTRTPLKLSGIGNTVSSSIPMILEDYLSRDDARRIVLSGFGVGLSWASCLIERRSL